jgi:hypothetical protein
VKWPSLGPHFKFGLFFQHSTIKVNHFDTFIFRIVQNIFRLDIPMAYSFLMKVL